MDRECPGSHSAPGFLGPEVTPTPTLSPLPYFY